MADFGTACATCRTKRRGLLVLRSRLRSLTFEGGLSVVAWFRQLLLRHLKGVARLVFCDLKTHEVMD